MRIAKIHARNMRKTDGEYSLAPFTAFVGATGAGKSTRLAVPPIALQGGDGFLKKNGDIFDKYAAKGARRFGLGVEFDNGMRVDRLFKSGKKGVSCDISVSPLPPDDKSAQAHIAGMIGQKELLLPSDLAGRLSNAEERSGLLAKICKTVFDQKAYEALVAKLPEDLRKGAHPSLDGLEYLAEAIKDDLSAKKRQLNESASATRAFQEQSEQLDNLRAACPYSKAEVDAKAEAIAIARGRSEYLKGLRREIDGDPEGSNDQDVAGDSGHLAEMKARLVKLSETEEVNPDNARQAWEAVKEKAESVKKKSVRDLTAKRAELRTKKKDAGKKLMTADKTLKKRKEIHDLKKLALEAAKLGLDDGVEKLVAIESELDTCEAKNACPKCGYAFEDDRQKLRDEIARTTATLPALRRLATEAQSEKEKAQKQVAESEKSQKTAQKSVDDLDKEISDLSEKIEAAGQRDVDEVKAVGQAKATYDKAQTQFKQRESLIAEKKKLDSDIPELEARIAKREAECLKLPDVEKDIAEQTKAKAAVESTMKEIGEKAAALKLARERLADVEKLRDEIIPDLKDNLDDVKALRVRIIGESLKGFIEAARSVNVDPEGRSFDVATMPRMGKDINVLGLRDAAGHFYTFDVLSRGERLIFAAAFIVAVYAQYNPPLRILILDDCDCIIPELLTPFLQRLGTALKEGILTQIIAAGWYMPELEGVQRFELSGQRSVDSDQDAGADSGLEDAVPAEEAGAATSTLYRREIAMGIAQGFIKATADVVERIEIAGSLRRGLTRVHDVDIVVIPKLEERQGEKKELFGDGKIEVNLLHERLSKWCADQKIIAEASGEKIWRIRSTCEGKNLPIDVYFASERTWPTLLLIRTGSKAHNIKLCTLARDRDMKLKASGDGIEKGGKLIPVSSEAEIFTALGLDYVEAKEREA